MKPYFQLLPYVIMACRGMTLTLLVKFSRPFYLQQYLQKFIRYLRLGIRAETPQVNGFRGQLVLCINTSNLVTHESFELFVPAGDREEIPRQYCSEAY